MWFAELARIAVLIVVEEVIAVVSGIGRLDLGCPPRFRLTVYLNYLMRPYNYIYEYDINLIWK